MDNKNYDGIRWCQKNGYWHNEKYGYQHKYVYEKLTGLKVFDYQVVHHLDNDPSNNTAENLVCMTRSDHSYFHSTHPSDITRKRNSEAKKGNKFWLNKHHTDATKQKLREQNIGKTFKIKTIICPYCNKVGGINVMHRYHFENCKYKKTQKG